MKKYLIGCYNKSVILTYVGIAFAIFGMLNVERIRLAVLCLIAAGICDLFDGKVARMCERTEQEKEFGVQIDSLADVIASLVFPIVIMNEVCRTSEVMTVLSFIVSIMYILAGVTRLAWFNITTDGKTKHFQGLPVTAIAIIVPFVFLIFGSFSFFHYVLLGAYFLTAVLFVWNMKVPKPSGKGYIVLSALAIIAGILVYNKWW